jgi:hypothetical protein
MMKYRKLIAWCGLICCSVPQAKANSDIDLSVPAKRSIQVVVRADGSVVERLVWPDSTKTSALKSASRHGHIPASPEAWLARMIDPTKNGLAAKNPELFAEWLDAVTEPRFMTALASVVVTPEAYSSTLGKVVDPATVRNWAEFADPQLYLRWMVVGLDPRFYQAVFNRMTDSGKLRRWALYPAGLFPAMHEKALIGADAAPETPNREKPAIGAQIWLQLPPGESKANPWLLNGANYRY